MADPLQPGAVFAGHRIEGLAGRGGMGVVYKATHIALDHVVALKVISPALAQDPRFRRRFAEESRIAVSIRHPNVVAIHNAGEEDGLLFVTMDLIDGTDLRGLLHVHGRMSPEHAGAVIGEVAAALDAAHARGLVHRDIKPGNILIEGEGEAERVYLTDFGLARLVEASTGVTATGAFVGTLDYVAPEQIRGERVDARSDVYALGCVMFELLTGNPPFAARDDKVAKMYAHLQEEPPRVRILRPELPGELDLAVQRALAKDPEKRFPSAGDFARAVGAGVVGQPTVEAERSVGVGAAAPGPPEATTTAERGRDAGEPPQQPPSEPTVAVAPEPERPPEAAVARPRDPRPSGSRRRGALLAAAAGVVGVAVAAALILGGGDGDDDSAATTGETVASSTTDGGAGADEPPPPAPDAAIDGNPVPVGDLPVNLVHGEDGLYVTNRKSNTVSFVDGDPADELDTFPAGTAPEGIAAGAGSLWVSSAPSGELLRIDEQTGETVDTIEVGELPGGVAFGDGSVWVANYGGSTVSRVDPGSGAVREITVGAAPYGLALSGDDAVWVTNRAGNSITRINTDSNRADDPIPVGTNPKGIAVGDDGQVWVANTDDGTVSRVEAGKERERIPVGTEPRGVVAAFGSVWVTIGGADLVKRLDPGTAKVVQKLPVGQGPEGVTVGPRSVWVANGISDDLTRIDPGVDG